MAFLSRESIIEALTEIKNGRLARICYETEIPVKAYYHKAGIRVFKTVEKTVRIGVFYGNIASVKARALENPHDGATPKKESPYEWIINNRIRKHKTNGKEYLQIAHLKDGSNKKEKFKVCFGDEIINVKDRETFELYNFDEYVYDSHWSYDATKTVPEVQYIALENVIRINDFGHRVDFN